MPITADRSETAQRSGKDLPLSPVWWRWLWWRRTAAARWWWDWWGCRWSAERREREFRVCDTWPSVEANKKKKNSDGRTPLLHSLTVVLITQGIKSPIVLEYSELWLTGLCERFIVFLFVCARCVPLVSCETGCSGWVAKARSSVYRKWLNSGWKSVLLNSKSLKKKHLFKPAFVSVFIVFLL